MRAVGNVMGIGYEGRSLDEVMSTLRIWECSTVVDVRLNPVSRKRGFSRKSLAAALGEQGIGYVHLRALGNPVDNRSGFAHPGSAQASAAHSRFVDEVLRGADAQTALAEIERLAAQGVVALLCFEAAASCCHRSLVMDALQSRALQTV
ncbi:MULTISPECIES: DUF488 domain-containing protein [unclassified Cellulomonas]|uniref:DUF488 domain-containing protein n=1 Tax=unclassified Cellulomonas TaxID=2620175 RepID=UPI00198EFB44|nr:DUF488 domain-containing protein [Cellulomonas sp. ES6]MBD3779819.1 DUF488 domain-containing protein [Micrococcales bacterium]WHP18297.1 DUF488 domain-containing protein [Cellulomonas sp. ES6]